MGEAQPKKLVGGKHFPLSHSHFSPNSDSLTAFYLVPVLLGNFLQFPRAFHSVFSQLSPSLTNKRKRFKPSFPFYYFSKEQQTNQVVSITCGCSPGICSEVGISGSTSHQILSPGPPYLGPVVLQVHYVHSPWNDEIYRWTLLDLHRGPSFALQPLIRCLLLSYFAISDRNFSLFSSMPLH